MMARAMANADETVRAALPVAEEDALRAEMYGLLAAVLRMPPDAAMLDALASLEGDESEIGRAVAALARVAERSDEGRAAREHHDLFVGLGRGELVPYGSYYLTGFLHEKPLGDLRRAMRERGLQRVRGVSEPEDHAAGVLEAMAALVDGRHGTPAGHTEQKLFFEAHVGSWMPYFFRDLEGAKAAVLYAPVGTIGRALMEVEAAAFEME